PEAPTVKDSTSRHGDTLLHSAEIRPLQRAVVMPAMGLGRVKTVRLKQERVAISVRWRFAVTFRGLRLFRSRPAPDAGCSSFLERFCDGYYAFIAAISGWMPMMFMARVRL